MKLNYLTEGLSQKAISTVFPGLKKLTVTTSAPVLMDWCPMNFEEKGD